MAVSFFDIADARIWLASYNPRDPVTLLYCDYAVGRAAELLKGVSRDEVHAWLRKRFPECDGLLSLVEQGIPIPPDAGLSMIAVTPGQERYELPIITHLLSLRQGGPNGHAV